MVAVLVNPPEDLLAERRKLGLDLFDEMWEGELHMVPAPSYDHQSLSGELFIAFSSAAKPRGLKVLFETGLYDPDVAGHESFRVPDVTVFEPGLRADRGIDGPASLVVEIRSPRDESYQKLPYYERLGVGEVLIVEPRQHRILHWANGPDGLVESTVGPAGEIDLKCLPLRLRYQGADLVIERHDADGGLAEVVRA